MLSGMVLHDVDFITWVVLRTESFAARRFFICVYNPGL